MKAEQFTGYLEDPGSISAEVADLFGEIIREYPYCQPAQLLFLKSLQIGDNISFNRQLKIASAYSADRKLLYELLNVPKNTGPKEPATDLNAGTQQAPSVHQAAPDMPPAADYQKTGLVRQVEEYLPIEDSDLLPFDFPAYSEDGFPEVPSRRIVPEFEDSDAVGVSDEAPGTETDEELLQQFLETDPLSRERNKPPLIKSMRIGREPAEGGLLIPRRTPADDLIDRFIGNKDSKVMRPDQAPGNNQDVSVGSLREDDEFLTETLARIYVQQGYLQKAIQAYQKLSLKIPEKSIYFASQIEMVRELIKNQ